MRIGVDIDGVLTNLEDFYLEYGSKYCVENNIDYGINAEGYEPIDIFNLNNQDTYNFWIQYLKTLAINNKPRYFATEVINLLKQEGNEIYIVTARYLTDKDDEPGKQMKNIVKSWLEENNIIYDELIFSGEDKLQHCIKYNIDLMIEDKVENVNHISTKIPVICFDTRYNKQCIGKNIIRCYSWYDIYNKIQNLNI